MTKLLEMPKSSRLRSSALALEELISLAIEAPDHSELRQEPWLFLREQRRDQEQIRLDLPEDRRPESWRWAPEDNKALPGTKDI